MKLKELRIAQNLNQKELAEKLGYSQNTISQWESEKRSMDADTLVRVADFFDVSVDFLLDRECTVCVEVKKDTETAFTKRMMYYCSQLNDFGQREAIKRISELCMIPQYVAGAGMPIAAHAEKIDDKELELMRQDIDEL